MVWPLPDSYWRSPGYWHEPSWHLGSVSSFQCPVSYEVRGVGIVLIQSHKFLLHNNVTELSELNAMLSFTRPAQSASFLFAQQLEIPLNLIYFEKFRILTNLKAVHEFQAL